MLYSKNAKVYLAARSEERANQAIEEITRALPNSAGSILFLKLDLNDLSTIKASAQSFLAKETKLNVLFNNAGLMGVTPGPLRTAQGYEVNLGTNVIAPFLFTKLLTPILVSTAKTEAPGAVRVVWTSSLGTETTGEKSIGVSVDDIEALEKRPGMERYALSKAGDWLLGVEYARRFSKDGVISVPLNPGNLNSNLAREHTSFIRFILSLIVHPPVKGGYTLLYGGLSPDLTIENSGTWGELFSPWKWSLSQCHEIIVYWLITNLWFSSVVPWGRIYPIREDLVAATKPKEDGGNGHACAFWEWNEEQVKQYL